MFWNNNCKVDILGDSIYHIDARVTETGQDPWRITCIYGEAQTHLRHQTWDVLKGISTMSDLPWLYFGDFNEVLLPEEHDGAADRSNAQIQAFRDAVDVCMLMDLGYQGRPWTFEKRVAGGTYTRCRLDRALVNSDCLARFPLASVTHETAASSDHLALLLDFGRAKNVRRKHEFKYETMWETHEGLNDVVA